MNEIIDFFISPYKTATPFDIALELLAVICGIVSVWMAKIEHILVYPIGIISTAIYIYICFNISLYGDLIIYIYYTLMGIYGWYMWRRTKGKLTVKISYSETKDILLTIGIFISTVIITIIVYLCFNRFNTLIDYIDTFTTGVFFAAMWLMAHKKMEHWWLWIIGNLISVPLYFVKGLGFSSIQFVIFIILAFLGYRQWKIILNKSIVKTVRG